MRYWEVRIVPGVHLICSGKEGRQAPLLSIYDIDDMEQSQMFSHCV